MADRIREIKNICRFCLNQDSLMALSRATKSAFTILEIARFTGIQISEEDKLPYAICTKCYKAIEDSANFRRSCLNNDSIFQQLVAVLLKSVERKSNKFGSTSLVDEMNVPFVIDSTSEQSTAKPQLDEHGLDDELKTLDDCESDDSMPSLYGEVNDMRNSPYLETGSPNIGKKQNTTAAYNETKEQTASQFRQSVANVKSKPSDLCPYCGLMVSEIVHHIKRRHCKEKIYSCPYCPKKESERFNLKLHINTVHEKKITKTCEYCGKGFTNHSSHFYHLVNSHRKSKENECETCHRKFKSYDGYNKHMKEHAITSLPCTDCGRLFKTIATLERHQRRYH